MIKHVLKDGTIVKDIKGYLVKQKDVPLVYQIREQMKRKEKKEWASSMKI